MRLRRAALFALLLAIAPATAMATGVDPGQATPVQREQAQTRFVKGKQKYDAGDYKSALDEFQASTEIVQSPNTRLYVARAYREMGKLVEAYVEFGRTMIEAREHAAADGRYAKAAEAATNERDRVAPYLGFATITVSNPTEESKLIVGGNEIKRAGWTEPVPVMPGDVELRVDTPGHDPVRQTVKMTAGQKIDVALDAATNVKALAPPPPPPTTEPHGDGTTTALRISAVALGGVGVVGLVMFAAAGTMSLGTYSDLEKRCGKGTPCPTSLQGEVSRGKTEQTVANVGLVLAIVGLAGAGALFATSIILKPSKTEAAPAAVLSFGPGSVALQGTF